MNEFLQVLALSMLPAFGNFAGGVLAELIRASNRVLSIVLHAAAGVVVAVVAVELMPRVLTLNVAWLGVLSFVLGGIAFTLLDAGTDLIESRFNGGAQRTGRSPWPLFLGVCVDLFTDGVLIGTGRTLSFGLALLLALGQTPADIPEGFATQSTFREEGVSRKRRFVYAGLFVIPILLGASVGYWLLRNAAEAWKLCVLAFASGLLITLVIEEIMPRAHEGKDYRTSSLAFLGGFALFALLSAYVG